MKLDISIQMLDSASDTKDKDGNDTVSGVVDINGQCLIVEKHPVKNGSKKTQRSYLLVAAALVKLAREQGEQHER